MRNKHLETQFIAIMFRRKDISSPTFYLGVTLWNMISLGEYIFIFPSLLSTKYIIWYHLSIDSNSNNHVLTLPVFFSFFKVVGGSKWVPRIKNDYKIREFLSFVVQRVGGCYVKNELPKHRKYLLLICLPLCHEF